jgi:hypothetical protein
MSEREMLGIAPDYATEQEAAEIADRMNHELTAASAVYGKYEVRPDGDGFAVRWRNFNI